MIFLILTIGNTDILFSCNLEFEYLKDIRQISAVLDHLGLKHLKVFSLKIKILGQAIKSID